MYDEGLSLGWAYRDYYALNLETVDINTVILLSLTLFRIICEKFK